jgi:predicted esterase
MYPGQVVGGDSGAPSYGTDAGGGVAPAGDGDTSGLGGDNGSNQGEMSDSGLNTDAGSSGTSGSNAGGNPSGMKPSMLPTPKGTCAPLTNGTNQITVNGKGMTWTLSVGSKSTGAGGPIIIYWHGTGTSGQEAQWGLGQAAISEVQSMGGVVAAAETTSGTGTNTGDGVWYTGDFDYSDQIIACAIQQFNIDTSHIHAAGYSAGALQTAQMFYSRAGYLASVVVYSGGAFVPGASADSSNHIPVLGAHGSTSGDFLASNTTSWEMTVKSAGSFVIDCDDGGSHEDITRLTRLGPSAWLFFKSHPFKIGSPDPYAGGIPSSFPTYCKII